MLEFEHARWLPRTNALPPGPWAFWAASFADLQLRHLRYSLYRNALRPDPDAL